MLDWIRRLFGKKQEPMLGPDDFHFKADRLKVVDPSTGRTLFGTTPDWLTEAQKTLMFRHFNPRDLIDRQPSINRSGDDFDGWAKPAAAPSSSASRIVHVGPVVENSHMGKLSVGPGVDQMALLAEQARKMKVIQEQRMIRVFGEISAGHTEALNAVGDDRVMQNMINQAFEKMSRALDLYEEALRFVAVNHDSEPWGTDGPGIPLAGPSLGKDSGWSARSNSAALRREEERKNRLARARLDAMSVANSRAAQEESLRQARATTDDLALPLAPYVAFVHAKPEPDQAQHADAPATGGGDFGGGGATGSWEQTPAPSSSGTSYSDSSSSSTSSSSD